MIQGLYEHLVQLKNSIDFFFYIEMESNRYIAKQIIIAIPM